MTATYATLSTVLVAIDISKHRHEVLISIPGKKRRRRRTTIMNTLEVFQRLAINLASYDLPVRIGFEATGNYHRVLAHHLGQAGFELKLVSSVGLAQMQEACTTAGIRTTLRTPRSSCTCWRSARFSSITIRW